MYNTPKRVWKIRGCIEHVLSHPRLSGQQLEKIIGHVTFALLIRRELLSILSSVYAFIVKNYDKPTWLWASVKRELAMIVALLPLASADCRQQWDTTVYCSEN